MKLRRNRQTEAPGRRPIRNARPGAPQAFSYYSQRSTRELNVGREVGHEEATKQPSRWRGFVLQRIGLTVLLVAIVLVLVSGLSLSAAVRVIPLNTASSQPYMHTLAAYSDAASSILARSIWDRNKITVDTAGLSRDMQAQFPELSSVTVTLPLLGHKPVLYIQPAQPVLIITGASGSFVLGQNGKALLPTNQLPANSKLNLPVLSDQTGLQLHAGKQALTSADVAFIQLVLAQLAVHKFTVSSMALPPVASELDIRLNGQPYFVKFNMHASRDDARQQAGTFIAVSNKLASQHITPAQYIDVRVDGRAYYQ